MDCSPPGSSVHGIFQTKTVEWVTISFNYQGGSWEDMTVGGWGGRWLLKNIAPAENIPYLLVLVDSSSTTSDSFFGLSATLLSIPYLKTYSGCQALEEKEIGSSLMDMEFPIAK